MWMIVPKKINLCEYGVGKVLSKECKMNDYDLDRARQSRSTANDDDWDWDYYYEYRYIPYSPYHQNDYDRNYYGGNYYNRNFYGQDQNARGYYNRDYDYDYGMYPYGRSSYGRYSGVGPRGYQRSDERIEDDINDRLTWHGQLDATDIHVGAQKGVATVKGTVADRRPKRIAEDITESVSGVEDVNNELKIKNRRWNPGQSGMSDMQGQIRPGMEVVGRDGDHVGEVKEVRASDFLVDRSLARDVYIPLSACQITNGQIRLNVGS